MKLNSSEQDEIVYQLAGALLDAEHPQVAEMLFSRLAKVRRISKVPTETLLTDALDDLKQAAIEAVNGGAAMKYGKTENAICVKVPVHYVSAREPTPHRFNNPYLAFGGKWASELHFGIATVSVPVQRHPFSLEQDKKTKGKE